MKSVVTELESGNRVIDQLILNAGIVEESHPHVNPFEITRNDLLRVLDVNVLGTNAAMQHFLPLVKKSGTKKVSHSRGRTRVSSA